MPLTMMDLLQAAGAAMSASAYPYPNIVGRGPGGPALSTPNTGVVPGGPKVPGGKPHAVFPPPFSPAPKLPGGPKGTQHLAERKKKKNAGPETPAEVPAAPTSPVPSVPPGTPGALSPLGQTGRQAQDALFPGDPMNFEAPQVWELMRRFGFITG